MRSSSVARFLAILAVIALLAYITVSGAAFLGIPALKDMRFGIDIKGGVYTTLYPELDEGEKADENDLAAARSVIEKRLDEKGIFDRNITTEAEKGRIIVEIPYKPGETDLNPQKTVDEIGKTALLTFQEVDENLKDENGDYLPTGKIVLKGEQVKNAMPQRYQDTGQMVVALELNDEGAKNFEEATGRLIGLPIAIFMDDQLISYPTVESQISGGNAVITGMDSPEEAGNLAATIRAGSLPFRLVAQELNSISPLLGESALQVSIKAGIIAFILICLFMILYYRLPGLMACIALVGLVVIEILVMNIIGVSLTLPGIAGIILSMGMGVDANVNIFERLKEELRTGKTVRAAVDVGFKRAFSAIFDSNMTTLITSVVLYWLGSGPIRGFAITLTLGVALSFLTAVTGSRLLLKAVSDMGLSKNRWLYGA